MQSSNKIVLKTDFSHKQRRRKKYSRKGKRLWNKISSAMAPMFDYGVGIRKDTAQTAIHFPCAALHAGFEATPKTVFPRV